MTSHHHKVKWCVWRGKALAVKVFYVFISTRCLFVLRNKKPYLSVCRVGLGLNISRVSIVVLEYSVSEAVTQLRMSSRQPQK